MKAITAVSFSILDHLKIMTSKDNVESCEKLIKEGALDQEGTVNANKLNQMSGASVSHIILAFLLNRRTAYY